MPLPAALPPLALKLGGYALTAAVAWSAARRVEMAGPRAAAREATLDEMPEGATLTRAQEDDRARLDLDARLRREFRLGPDGPGFAADLSAMARLRLKRLAARRG